jgi:hypothetical protein
VKRPHMRVTTTQSNTLPLIAEMAGGSCYGGLDEAASGEAVLRECVGRPVSISASQFPHNALVGNPNRSFSEFDSCLPDLVLQVHAAAAHNEHGMDTSIMPRLATSLATRTSTILSRSTTCLNCMHY